MTQPSRAGAARPSPRSPPTGACGGGGRQAQAEAYGLAEAHGIPRETAHELLCAPGGLFASIPLMPAYGAMVARRAYEPVGFTAENGLKVRAAAGAGLARRGGGLGPCGGGRI